jgi:hypothetical protein
MGSETATLLKLAALEIRLKLTPPSAADTTFHPDSKLFSEAASGNLMPASIGIEMPAVVCLNRILI